MKQAPVPKWCPVTYNCYEQFPNKTRIMFKRIIIINTCHGCCLESNSFLNNMTMPWNTLSQIVLPKKNKSKYIWVNLYCFFLTHFILLWWLIINIWKITHELIWRTMWVFLRNKHLFVKLYPKDLCHYRNDRINVIIQQARKIIQEKPCDKIAEH